MREIILDTGPFVALLDRSERSHKACATFFEGIKEAFTLDRRGFTTYRIHRRKAFTIYPEDSIP